jgi:hypothetical protein
MSDPRSVDRTTNMPELHSKILVWMKKHGAPLELRCARMLREAGWEVEHSHFFIDPVSQKHRELDLLASRTLRGPDLTTLTFALAVDCKQSPEKPWVVFSAASDSGYRQLPMHFVAGVQAEQLVFEALGIGGEFPRPFRVGPRIGHGVVKAFTDAASPDPSGAYAALQSVASAATAVNLKAERLLGIGSPAFSEATLAFPVLAVDAPLFEYYADEDGTEHLAEIREMVVVTPHPSRAGRSLNVTIVGVDHLAEYAAQCVAALDPLRQIMLPMVPSFAQEVRKTLSRGSA